MTTKRSSETILSRQRHSSKDKLSYSRTEIGPWGQSRVNGAVILDEVKETGRDKENVWIYSQCNGKPGRAFSRGMTTGI